MILEILKAKYYFVVVVVNGFFIPSLKEEMIWPRKARIPRIKKIHQMTLQYIFIYHTYFT